MLRNSQAFCALQEYDTLRVWPFLSTVEPLLTFIEANAEGINVVSGSRACRVAKYPDQKTFNEGKHTRLFRFAKLLDAEPLAWNNAEDPG